jgi:hypothetical protein
VILAYSATANDYNTRRPHLILLSLITLHPMALLSVLPPPILGLSPFETFQALSIINLTLVVKSNSPGSKRKNI